MKKVPLPCLSVFIVLASFLGSTLLAGSPARLYYDQSTSQGRFAASEIRSAFMERGIGLAEAGLGETGRSSRGWEIILAHGDHQARQVTSLLGLTLESTSAPQSYRIRTQHRSDGKLLVVVGADPTGMMYGGLDIAEAVRLDALPALADCDRSPYISRRGIKFNIPLDARTPSYSDNSDSAQYNIPEMWSFDFWREFLDEMARHRFNVLTLWSLHPFPSLVKVPEYPEVALNDVMRTTLKMDDSFSHTGDDMVRPEILGNLEVVKKIGIGEKIRFWRDVMQHAHERGIEVYLFTWNIFTYGAEGKHGITGDQTNPVTIDYFRASVRETVLTYPHLAGFGITSGERMEARKDEFSKEKWLWKTYGEGIRDAKKVQPSRSVRLIHRFHQTALGEILGEWKDYPDTFDLSFKYSIAHMYSVPNPPFIKGALPHLHERLRTWLTVRNDDIYSFRWGDPDFARAFVRAIPGPDKIAGFYMGPDGYNWGRESLSTEPETPRQLVMKKQWYSFMLWGRLSYDPDLPDDLFRQTLASRFPEVPSDKLYSAWAAASRIFPQTTRFFWKDIDLRWFPEACLSHPRYRGFFTVRDFIEADTMPHSGILDILSYRERLLKNEPSSDLTPLQVAEALRGHALEASRLVRELRSVQGALANKELRLTLGDLEAMAHLGNYYAAKIVAATELALFDRTSDQQRKQSAVEHLEVALEQWKRYAEVAGRQYKPQLLNRVGYVDLKALTAKVEEDIAMARQWQPGTISTKKGGDWDTPFRP
jgi:hypothetical protein